MYDPIFLPSDSRAMRQYSNKSKGRLSGEGPVATPDHPHPFVLGFESGEERKIRAMLLANPNVVDLIDQPFRIETINEDGEVRTSVPDYLAKFNDGSSAAIEVKPADRVKSLDFERRLAFFSQFLRPDQADEIILVTDESYETWEATNAERLLEMRREPDGEADELVESLAAGLTSPTTIDELIEQAKIGGRAFPAIFRAIYAGVLRQVENGPINLTTIVEKGAVQ